MKKEFTLQLKSGGLPQRLSLLLVSERGNVESALTLIPILILFLTVAQLALSVYTRAINDEETQGAVAYAAMGASQGDNPQLHQQTSADPYWKYPPVALPLPGGGSLLVGERQIHSSSITPLLPGGDTFSTSGVAVQE